MRFLCLPAALLVACQTENELTGKDAPATEFDSGSDWEPPDTDTEDTAVPPEECNGQDDDGDGLVDEDFPDANGNGRADCLDGDCDELDIPVGKTLQIPEECEGGSTPEVTDPWDVGIEWQYTSGGSGVIVMPAVGNLTDDNGDGQVDEDDIPDIAYTTWSENKLEVLSGDGSGLVFSVSGFDGQGGVTIADVDADGTPEVVAIATGYRIAAVDGSGTTKWTSAAFSMMAYPQPTVADLDNDGMPEVIGDVGVVNGEDGSTVATLGGLTNSWRTPVAADLDQDGTQEIILANRVFDENGNVEWSNAGTGSGNFSAVVQADSDDGGEVFFASGSTVYLHDDDGSVITSFAAPGSNPGPPCAADFDGDGEVELAVPANTNLTVFDIDGTELWTTRIDDSSGLAGCSGYDVNGDGAYEVLYADQAYVRIYDGTSGTVLYENGSHDSGTVWEYPVTADVDKDGSAEIIYASNGSATRGITVLGHNGSGWAKSGETWGTHDFAVTNLNPDGTVPSPPEASWLKYNVFRARPIVDDPAAGDLVVDIADVCIADCEYGPVAVSVTVGNMGGNDISAGNVLNLYADDDTGERLVATYTLPDIAAGTQLDGITFELTTADIGLYGFVARVDEAGDESECTETNNEVYWTETFCP